MRRIIWWLFASVVMLSACAGSNTASSTAASTAATAGAAGSDERGGSPSTPVATGGTSETDSAGVRGASIREMTLPAGTHLPVVLETTVGSDISRVEEPVRAHLSQSIELQGVVVLPEGSRLSGIVTDLRRPGPFKGNAHIAVRFDTLVPAGQDERYRIDTAAVGRTAPSTAKRNALEIGLPAAGGAVIGGLLGGKKGALIGTAAGGGAGTAIVVSTRGREIHLPRGAALTLRLVKPITVRDRGTG